MARPPKLTDVQFEEACAMRTSGRSVQAVATWIQESFGVRISQPGLDLRFKKAGVKSGSLPNQGTSRSVRRLVVLEEIARLAHRVTYADSDDACAKDFNLLVEALYQEQATRPLRGKP